jgi:carbamoyl-phosphate synthase large subunit
MVKKYSKVLIIGSGPVRIGQASEYDYSSVQACKAFREDGIKIIVINSNPATIHTDKDLADAVYIEPLNIDVLKRVISLEKPDAILPTMGGEIGYDLALQLQQSGCLEENDIALLSVSSETLFRLKEPDGLRKYLSQINEPAVDCMVSNNTNEIISFAQTVGMPVKISHAYEPYNHKFSICYEIEKLNDISNEFLEESQLHQILIEKCVSGWKEIEYEGMCDCAGNCISISNMENLDPVGIHAGDSIVVVPAQTLTDNESLKLRAATLNIISKLKITGNCGVQFALDPVTGDYVVLAITPGISRSSALISKVTGYPIARVAAKLAVGYKLFEIRNDITGCTTACNEPAIDYCAIKFPRWSFDKFENAKRKLGTGMQATGETVSLGTSFELAFMKAVRSINIGLASPSLPKIQNKSNDDLLGIITESNDERIFAVYEAVKRNISFDIIYAITYIDKWFLAKLKNIANIENQLTAGFDKDIYRNAKKYGFLDETIKNIANCTQIISMTPSYKMIDTCAAEFDAVKPYFYSSYDDENEVFMVPVHSDKDIKKILVIGSGPASIGYASELDYCNVHCIKALKMMGYSVITANNNPESVTTDFYLTDRLYLDPLSVEDIKNLIETEHPTAVIAQFSGENESMISELVIESESKLLGPEPELEDMLKSPDKLGRRLVTFGIPYSREKLFNATGLEVDVLCDGEDCLIPGISEHIEKSGIHPGDSISVYPAVTLSEKIKQTVLEYSIKIAKGLGIKGIFNIQMVLYDNKVYVTGISTKTMHNIAFMSKVTGLPIIQLAVRCMLGEKLLHIGFGTGIYPEKKYFGVRVPVFSFDSLSGTDTQLGSEMKSTGEVLGIADNFEDALLKGLSASGMRIKRSGGVLITVRNSDKQEAISVADRFSQLEFNLFSTAGTAKTLNANHVPSSSVRKIHEGHPNVLDLIKSNKIVYVISTSEKAENALGDDIKIRRNAIERKIPTFTTLETANALVRCLSLKRSMEDIGLVDITKN